MLERQDIGKLNATERWMIPRRDISFDRIQAMRAKALGNFDEAEEHFAAAMDCCGAAGYGPELAWSCYDYVGVLPDRGDVADINTGSKNLDRVMEIAKGVGMKTLEALAAEKRTDIKP